MNNKKNYQIISSGDYKVVRKSAILQGTDRTVLMPQYSTPLESHFLSAQHYRKPSTYFEIDIELIICVTHNNGSFNVQLSLF